MRAYELMIIFDAELDEAAVTAQLSRVTEFTESGGGRVASTDVWGKRRLAYEINHKYEGTYVVLEIVTSAGLDEVDRYLRLADETIRHKIFRLPDPEAARRGLLGEPVAVTEPSE